MWLIKPGPFLDLILANMAVAYGSIFKNPEDTSSYIYVYISHCTCRSVVLDIGSTCLNIGTTKKTKTCFCDAGSCSVKIQNMVVLFKKL